MLCCRQRRWQARFGAALLYSLGCKCAQLDVNDTDSKRWHDCARCLSELRAAPASRDYWSEMACMQTCVGIKERRQQRSQRRGQPAGLCSVLAASSAVARLYKTNANKRSGFSHVAAT